MSEPIKRATRKSMIDDAYQQLLHYRRIITLASLGLGVLWSIALISALFLEMPSLVSFIIGGFIGSTLAVINVFTLGIAAYALFIKKSSRLFILGPFVSFNVLVLGALITVVFHPQSTLGFALGLSSPLILAAAIAFFEYSTAIQG